MIKYQAKVFKDGDSYSVIFPDLPGCFSSGSTKEDVIHHAKEALSLFLEEARDENWEIPRAKKRKGKDYYWITPYPDVGIPLMIRQARKQQGLSQKQLAKLLGIKFQQLQKLETPGKSNPTVKTLSAISAALNGTIDIQLVA
ncbi:MAG: type II toxin-antitoxin system HicB family antitoxin [Bdellovibrionota bacterium]